MHFIKPLKLLNRPQQMKAFCFSTMSQKKFPKAELHSKQHAETATGFALDLFMKKPHADN